MTADANLFFCGAVVLSAISFSMLGWLAVRTLSESARSFVGEYSQSTAKQFEDLFLFIPPRRIAELGWVCAVMAFLAIAPLVLSSGNPVLVPAGIVCGLIAAFCAFRLPGHMLVFMKNRRRKKFDGQLVDALGQMSNALKAGFSITQAFESVAKNGENPIAQEFGVFLQQQRIGVGFLDALKGMGRRVGSEDLDLVIAAMEIARRTGGNLTEIFDKISLTIRERMRIERRVMTLTAQGRMQGIVVGAMPLVVGAGMAILRPEIMMPYLKSPQGLAGIAAVVVLVTLGALSIRKIIRVDV